MTPDRRAQRAAHIATASAKDAEADKPSGRMDVAGLVADGTAHTALLGMTVGTDDRELASIRNEHAACVSADCPHLAAFDRHEARVLAAGRRWTLSPDPQHKRPR